MRTRTLSECSQRKQSKARTPNTLAQAVKKGSNLGRHTDRLSRAYRRSATSFHADFSTASERRPRPLPSTFFIIYYPLPLTHLTLIQSDLLSTSLNKQQQRHYIYHACLLPTNCVKQVVTTRKTSFEISENPSFAR